AQVRSRYDSGSQKASSPPLSIRPLFFAVLHPDSYFALSRYGVRGRGLNSYPFHPAGNRRCDTAKKHFQRLSVILWPVNVEFERRIFEVTTADAYRRVVEEVLQGLCGRVSQFPKSGLRQQDRMPAMASLPRETDGVWVRGSELEDAF